MSSRLNELRRQRALVQEHLAWLDREIAAETDKALGTSTAVTGTSPALAPAPNQPSPLASPAAPFAPLASSSTRTITAEDPDAILEQYRTSSDSLRTDVRKGCFLYFVAALVALVAFVAILYFALSRR